MTDDHTDDAVRVVSRREAMTGAGLALGSLVATGGLTERVLAQSGGPSDEISGTVEDDSGPVDGATVVAVPHDTSLAALETTTDASGDYIFERADLHEDSNLYHVIARDGTETDPRRGEQNYPFIAAEGPVAIPDSGISRYTFNTADTDGSTAIDVWDGNDGTINGATTGATGANQTYTTYEAYSFDGTDDYVNLNNTSWFSGATASFGAWIYPRSSSGDGRVLNQSDSDQTDWGFMYDHDTNEINPFISSETNGFVGFRPTTRSHGSWYHVMVTYDGSTITCYVDGESVGSTSQSGNIRQTATDTAVGQHYQQGKYFDGRIDDIRLYDKSLTSTEVSNLYNTGSIDG